MLFSILVNRRRHRAAMEKLRSGFSKQRAIGAIVETYRAGDYETALSAADALKEIDPSSYHFFRGWLLMQLDRFDEAERHLRNSAVMRSDGLLAAIVHSSLGQLLLERQQYERALECFQTSLRYAPERGATHRDFADAWLRRGDPQQGLKWAELAVAKERVSKMPPESRDLDLSENLATLAWAVACASRDRAKVDRLVRRPSPSRICIAWPLPRRRCM
jgi:tetratricopeptide (TPR) repeat protein